MTSLDGSATWDELRAAMLADLHRELDATEAARAVPWSPEEARQEGRMHRRRAELYGIPTSALARNYIRIGLSRPDDG